MTRLSPDRPINLASLAMLFLQIIPPVSMCIFGIPVEYMASVLYAEGTEHLS